MHVEGRCHCGAIAYEAEVQPGTVMICHCTDCQMQTGSAFRTNIPAPAATLRILKGTPRLYTKTASSGNKRIHAFCDNCGTPIYACAAEANPATYSLRVGALDRRLELGRPVRQIWTKRRLAWLPPIEGTTEFEGQP